MKEQNIEKIISQAEACSASLKQLLITSRDVMKEESDGKEVNERTAETLIYSSIVSGLVCGSLEQLNYLKEMVATINSIKKEEDKE